MEKIPLLSCLILQYCTINVDLIQWNWFVHALVLRVMKHNAVEDVFFWPNAVNRSRSRFWCLFLLFPHHGDESRTKPREVSRHREGVRGVFIAVVVLVDSRLWNQWFVLKSIFGVPFYVCVEPAYQTRSVTANAQPIRDNSFKPWA